MFCLLQILPDDYAERGRAAGTRACTASCSCRASEGIYRSLPDGGFLDVNPAMARIFGYDSPAQLLLALQRPRAATSTSTSARRRA